MIPARKCEFPPGRVGLHTCLTNGAIDKPRSSEYTDRVLFKGSQLDLAVYSRAELKGSDHRPGLYAFISLEPRTDKFF